MPVYLSINQSSSLSSVYLYVWKNLANAFSRCTAGFCARKRVEGGMDYGVGPPHSPLILDRDPQTWGKEKGFEGPPAAKINSGSGQR